MSPGAAPSETRPVGGRVRAGQSRLWGLRALLVLIALWPAVVATTAAVVGFDPRRYGALSFMAIPQPSARVQVFVGQEELPPYYFTPKMRKRASALVAQVSALGVLADPRAVVDAIPSDSAQASRAVRVVVALLQARPWSATWRSTEISFSCRAEPAGPACARQGSRGTREGLAREVNASSR